MNADNPITIDGRTYHSEIDVPFGDPKCRVRKTAVNDDLDLDRNVRQLLQHQARTIRRLAFLTRIIATLAGGEEPPENDRAGLRSLLKEMREEKRA